MDELKAWKLTSAQIWLLSIVGFVIWTVGADLDGASPVAILIIPPLLALWAWIILVVDRWVRNGADSSDIDASAPRPH
jgi:hypothetical protein